jgi:lipopolysaccharide transport system ATP-binding protein
VSHSTNDVVTLCEKAIWLEHGRVRAIGASKDVCRDYLASIDSQISSAYLQSDVNEELLDHESAGARPRHLKLTAGDIAAIQDHVAAPLNQAADGPASSVMSMSANQAPDFLAEDTTGIGGGKIVSVQLVDDKGAKMSVVRGGEAVVLRIDAVAERDIRKPIIGFRLSNNRGVPLFAHNSADFTVNASRALPAGHLLTVRFTFQMPLLPAGDFVLLAGLADGDEANNALLDMRHDALLLHCSTTGARHGLVGLPLAAFDLEVSDAPVTPAEVR